MRQVSGRAHFIKRCFGIAFALCALVAIFWLLLTVADYNRYRVKQDCSQEIREYLTRIRETPATLSETELLPVAADGFYVVGPYIPEEEQFALVGTKWYLSTPFSDHVFSGLMSERAYLDDGRQVLVFVSEGKPVSTAVLDRANGDFLGTDNRLFSMTDPLVSRADPVSPSYWHISRAE